MQTSVCKLCMREGVRLQLSHIIPSFVFKWLKGSSGTGHMRFGENPNLRQQDGPKRYWLCVECEQLFEKSETRFASLIFHKIVSGEHSRFEYGEWLLRFAASLCWRSLLFQRIEVTLGHLDSTQTELTDRAIETWRRLALGDVMHPGANEIHLVALHDVVSYSDNTMPSNINRYISRTVGMDVAWSGDDGFVYVKIPRIAFVGFISMRAPKDWVGSRIKVRGGMIGKMPVVLPGEFGAYLKNMATRLRRAEDKISDRQNEKIAEAWRSELESAADSDTMRAMAADVQLFGKKAFE